MEKWEVGLARFCFITFLAVFSFSSPPSVSPFLSICPHQGPQQSGAPSLTGPKAHSAKTREKTAGRPPAYSHSFKGDIAKKNPCWVSRFPYRAHRSPATVMTHQREVSGLFDLRLVFPFDGRLTSSCVNRSTRTEAYSPFGQRTLWSLSITRGQTALQGPSPKGEGLGLTRPRLGTWVLLPGRAEYL